MKEYISYIVSILPTLLSGGGYWALALIVLLEGMPIIGSFVPGHVAIISAGFLARLGILNLWWVTILCIVMAVCGDILGFMWGRRNGNTFIQKFGKYVFLKEDHVERAKKIIDKHTGKAIILGKFSPMTRSLVPFLVGASGIDMRKFWIYNVIGSTCWVVASIFVGYIFGASYHVISEYLGHFIVIAIIATVLIAWGYRFVNVQFHVFKKYELFVLGLNLISLWTLAKTIQDRFSLNPFMVNFDNSVNIFMAHHTTPFMAGIAAWISIIGGTTTMILLFIIIGFSFLFQKKWRRCIIMLVSGGSTAVAVTLLKEIFKSPRPLNALQSLSDFSFPSGHAAMAAAFFLTFAYVFVPKMKSWITREIFIVLCVLGVIAIGLSRLVLNVHWASDVVSGWSLGVFLATGSILLVRYVGGLFLSKKNV